MLKLRFIEVNLFFCYCRLVLAHVEDKSYEGNVYPCTMKLLVCIKWQGLGINWRQLSWIGHGVAWIGMNCHGLSGLSGLVCLESIGMIVMDCYWVRIGFGMNSFGVV
jgi:hypothetical protein